MCKNTGKEGGVCCTSSCVALFAWSPESALFAMNINVRMSLQWFAILFLCQKLTVDDKWSEIPESLSELHCGWEMNIKLFCDAVIIYHAKSDYKFFNHPFSVEVLVQCLCIPIKCLYFSIKWSNTPCLWNRSAGASLINQWASFRLTVCCTTGVWWKTTVVTQMGQRLPGASHLCQRWELLSVYRSNDVPTT